MLRFAVRRLAFILAVSLGIVFFAFFGMRMARNSTSPAPSYNPLPAAEYAWTSTLDYMGNLLHGDMGTITVRSGRSSRQVSVAQIIADAYPKSMGLLLISLLVAALIGIPVGVFAAIHRRSPVSLATMTATLIGVSVPSFFAAALLQIAEIYWFRATGVRLVPVGGFGWDAHLVIPTLVLAARPLAHLARIAYMSFSEILEQDYIRTAHAKGLYDTMVTRGHAYPNAAVPILTALGVSLRLLAGQSAGCGVLPGLAGHRRGPAGRHPQPPGRGCGRDGPRHRTHVHDREPAVGHFLSVCGSQAEEEQHVAVGRSLKASA